MAKIRYAQIGVGHAHASKISVYRKSDDYQVVGVAEPNEALRRGAQDTAAFGDLPWLTVEQVLADDTIQVVGIETPVRDLLRHGQQAVEAGKHIHLDKPAGADLPAFQRLLDAAMRKHLAVQMGYMYRHNPAIVLLRDLLKRGLLGEPFEVHAVMSKKVNDSRRDSLREFAGGAMFELGCHLIDLVAGVLGEPQAVHPFLQATRKSLPDGDDLRDNTLAVLEYPRATATVRTSVIEVDGFARRHFVLCGTEGTMHIQPLDRPQARLTLARAAGRYQQGAQDVSFPDYQRYVDDAAELAAVVRHERDPLFSYGHDLLVQRLVLQASEMTTAAP